MKFGDIVAAVASLFVAYVLLDSVFLAMMIRINSYWGADVAAIFSLLIVSFIVGYVFAVKIREASRIEAIGRIAVLFSLLLVFLTLGMLVFPKQHSLCIGATWDWTDFSSLTMATILALNVVFALVFGFIGLYVGSMLRKPEELE